MIHLDYGDLGFTDFNFGYRKLIYKSCIEIYNKQLCPNSTKINYPFISNMKDLKLQTKLNEILKNFLAQFIFEQISTSIDFTNPNTFICNYKVFLNENSLLSIMYELYSYVLESAHGLTNFKSITLNTSTARVYSFKDLFKLNSNYKELLTEMVKKQIKEKSIDMIREYDGIKDSQQFYMTPSDLLLYYQPYEYTSYLYGPLMFPIPYKDIEDILNPALPIKVSFLYGLNSKEYVENNSIDTLSIALSLFKRAIEEFGAVTPEEAVDLWAKGVKSRNGALQYSLLSKDLKMKLEKSLRNTTWLTGDSSPWVEDYKVIKGKKIDSITYKAEVSFHMVGDKLDAGYVNAILTVEKKGNHWVITNIR